MPWTGSTFSIVTDFSAFRDADPAAAFIDADDVDGNFVDIASGLEECVKHNGDISWSGTMNAGANRLANLAAPTGDGDAATKAYAQSGEGVILAAQVFN